MRSFTTSSSGRSKGRGAVSFISSKQQHRDSREPQDPRDGHIEEGCCQDEIKKFKGTAWDQSPLFKQIYEAEYGTIGGEPFGSPGRRLLLRQQPAGRGDPVWHGSRSRRRVMRRSSRRPRLKLMNVESWRELSDPRTNSDEDFPDAGLRAVAQPAGNRKDSRYIGLTMPRNLARRAVWFGSPTPRGRVCV